MTPRPLFIALVSALACSVALAQPSTSTTPPDETEQVATPDEGDQVAPPPQQDPAPEVSSHAAQAVPPPVAQATRNVWDRMLALAINVGLDMPTGILGGQIEISPIRYFTFYAGGGIGRELERVAAGIRGQYPVGNGAVGLSVGVAGGPLVWDSVGMAVAGESQPVQRRWDFAFFLNAAFTFEYRFDEGWFIRASIGVEDAMTPADTCRFTGTATACNQAAFMAPVRTWAGLNLGYALDI